MSEIAKIIGERLRNYRLQAGYSQEALAEKARVHPTYIGQLERGEKNATLESVAKVAQALNLPLGQLFEHIIPGNSRESLAAACYQMIQSRTLEEQRALFDIMQKIVSYKES